MRWIIDGRPSGNVGLDETWLDWLKGLVELGFCQTLVSDSWDDDKLTCLLTGLTGRREKRTALSSIG